MNRPWLFKYRVRIGFYVFAWLNADIKSRTNNLPRERERERARNEMFAPIKYVRSIEIMIREARLF